jgi:hypothetical protein
MGDIEVEIDVNKTELVESALRQGLSNGLEDAGDYLLEEGEDKARDNILLTDRVWRGELSEGFSTNEFDFNRWYHWKGKIVNSAGHAEVVNDGLSPSAEAPKVQDILPWVKSEITPNASAQKAARNANLENWKPKLLHLVGWYGTAHVISAFAIQQSLDETGYPGINFMETTESYLRSLHMIVKSKIEKEMNKELRKKGLK